MEVAARAASMTAAARPPTLAAPLRRWVLSSETSRGLSLLSPTLLVMLGILAAPLVILVLYSFWTQATPLTVDTTFTLDRYEAVFTRESYQILFLRTITMSGIVSVVTVLLAYPVAYYVAFHVQRNKFIWLVLLTIPFWTSFLLRVFAWKVVLGYQGAINSGLISLGLISEPLEFLLYNPTAVVITLAHAYAAFAILPIYVSLEKIDRALLEAAADLGDGPWRRFWRVTFPLSVPGVIGALVVIFVPVTGDYVAPAQVGGTQGIMIANIILAQFKTINDWPMGAALALTSMTLVAVIVAATVWAIQHDVRRIR